jgi:hypothetical protein
MMNLKVWFSNDVINYVVRNDSSFKKKNRLLKNPLEAYHYCKCLHPISGHKFNTYECDYEDCVCNKYTQLKYKIEIYTLPNQIEFKYIHKTKPPLYWKLIELEVKQSSIIKDYVYQQQQRSNSISHVYL